jgi:hypothetical protein
MTIKTELQSIAPGTELDLFIRRVNDNLGLLLESIRDVDRRLDTLTDEVAKLRSAESIGDDEATTK